MSDETRRGTARRAITEAKEREIRAWLADGSPMRQIAARVGVSIADVRRIAQAAAASSHWNNQNGILTSGPKIRPQHE